MAALLAPHEAIEYEIEGTGDPIILICGLGSQLIRWSPGFRSALVAHGFQVIRFDNRDSGLSHGYDSAPPDLKALAKTLRAGGEANLHYRLSDMAGDVISLLDGLEIDRAHVLGVSMGGFIAQHVAADYADRVASLTLIMTSTGNPDLPGPSADAQALLARRGANSGAREGLIEQGVFNASVIASPGYPPDPAALRARVSAELDRSHRPAGYIRQRAAILADGDRRNLVERISAPTLILHGTDDPLVSHAGGEDLAGHIADSELHLFPGMGHEIPEQLVPHFAKLIAAMRVS